MLKKMQPERMVAVKNKKLKQRLIDVLLDMNAAAK